MVLLMMPAIGKVGFNILEIKKLVQIINDRGDFRMIASFKKKYVRVFLGISVLAMGNTFASGFERFRDVNVNATEGGKAIGVVNGNINAQEFHQHYHGASSPSSDDPLAFIEELHQQSENIRLNFESDPRIKDFKQTTLVIGPTGFGKSTFLT
jgi:hypothetical protein